MSEALTADINDLSVAEIELIEDVTDTPFDILCDPVGKKGRMLRALAFIVRRREDPEFTWEQAGNERIVLVDKENPHEPSGR
ncbi:hypothetical protein [Crossiella sp. CA198]|uniref:hypothetical protein n=1 Tax=Crossiella sp. CA198 TaxID=3455607 RepID=UPI003F8D7E7E